MTQIHILDHQTDEILDTMDNKGVNPFYQDNHKKSLKNSEELFHFFAPKDIRAAAHLNKRNRVIIPVSNGSFHEFIIYYNDTINNEVEVRSSASYIELKKNKPIAPVTLNGQTVNTATDFVLSGTGWKRGKTDYLGSLTIVFEDLINPYDALKKIASEFGLELQFRIETDGNRVIGRYVDLLKRVGSWEGKEIESGKDLVGMKRSESTKDVVTALVGVGPKRQDGTQEMVEVVNEEARQAWGRIDSSTGEPVHLWDIYIPESTDEDMTTERLMTLTENELQKRISSTAEWEIDVATLETIFGRGHEKVSLGDTARVKATEYNPPIYLDSRIIAIEGPITDPSKKKYTLGEIIEHKEVDINKIRQDLLNKIAKKMSEEQVLGVTYSKGDIDSKDTTVKTEAVDAAAVDATNKANNAKSEAITSSNQYTDNQLTNYVGATAYDQDMASLQAQIDNQITSWFKDYEPTLSNEPASLWTTNAEKDKHIGDLFYNSSTGYSYRFMLDATVYSWVLVRDEGIAKALQDAATAQDTADSKRRVFVAQPTTPYDAGDLWDNNGSVYRSTVTKTSSATFSLVDWTKIGDVTSQNTAADTVKVAGETATNIKNKANNSVQLGESYDGAKFSSTGGFESMRNDELVRVLGNAAVGFTIQRRMVTTDPWKDVIYFDTEGNAKFSGDLEATEAIRILNPDFNGKGFTSIELQSGVWNNDLTEYEETGFVVIATNGEGIEFHFKGLDGTVKDLVKWEIGAYLTEVKNLTVLGDLDVLGRTESYTYATLQNGWVGVNAPYRHPHYYVDSFGYVNFLGAMDGGTRSAYTPAFTMPAGLRPGHRQPWFQGTARVDVNTDGVVSVHPSSGIVSLYGIKYKPEN
ncbi:hypothetical protein KO561_12810 [Radiobacillus kanasensis]|uniref:phage tail spike protein n=1 Tax=Radiobacillus kanasensis TaxID=2844358 RepID=UPI001E417142|nr:phage tail spike protein [Radiobacillus kanasensis]UFT98083.1 hypothetical protein KO561_12810 [Radiobacillus kanasensis]